jgi:hypothetical protein
MNGDERIAVCRRGTAMASGANEMTPALTQPRLTSRLFSFFQSSAFLHRDAACESAGRHAPMREG